MHIVSFTTFCNNTHVHRIKEPEDIQKLNLKNPQFAIMLTYFNMKKINSAMKRLGLSTSSRQFL